MKRIKGNIKIIVGIVFGIFISAITSYAVAETLIKSADVSYVDNANLKATNVQDALDNTCTKFSNDLATLQTTIINKIYPVGSIYISYSSTNPSSFLGGTWEAFGKGQTLVGIDSSQTEFNTVGKTGGEKTHTLTIDEMPSHTHIFTGNTVTTSESGIHSHHMDKWTLVVSQGANTGSFDVTENKNHTGFGYPANEDPIAWRGTEEDGAHTHTVTATGSNSSSGGSKAHNNLQPYITVYMWKRKS